jgi:hypothetical protein
MGYTQRVGLFLTLLLSAASSWASRIVPVTTSVTFTAQQAQQPWSAPIYSKDEQAAYVLGLEPVLDAGGHVVTVNLVMRRAGARGDAPDLIEENANGLQPPHFTANDLAQRVQRSAFGEPATMGLMKLGLLLRVTVTGAAVIPNPTTGGYQINTLNLHIEVDNLHSTAPLSLGTPCSKIEEKDYIRPVFFDQHDGIAYGVSALRDHFKEGDEIRLYLLLSNESEQAIGYMVCKTTIMDEIEVVNSSGMRIPSGMELHYHKTKPTPEVGGCFGELKVEPGSCEVVNSGYLSPLDTGYDLKPGTYKIIEDHAPSHPISKIGEPVPPATWLQRGLTITIEPADR